MLDVSGVDFERPISTAVGSPASRSTLRSRSIKRFLECLLTSPLPLTRFSARSHHML